MYRIVLVTRNAVALSAFARALQADGKRTVEWVSSGEEALALIQRNAPDLMILDEQPGNKPDFALVRSIMHVNALVNIAMVGRMTEKEFHESSEGLGIIMQLPPHPGLPEAEALLRRMALDTTHTA